MKTQFNERNANKSALNRSKLTGGRRILAAAALGGLLPVSNLASAADTLAWDKTFPPSDKVKVEKVSFNNRLRINLVGDLYLLKGIDLTKKSSAIIVGHPLRRREGTDFWLVCPADGGARLCFPCFRCLLQW